MSLTKENAPYVLQAIQTKDWKWLKKFQLTIYGNKGRMWNNEACICDLDEFKNGECNPRLASNYCEEGNVGCPECIKALEMYVAKNKPNENEQEMKEMQENIDELTDELENGKDNVNSLNQKLRDADMDINGLFDFLHAYSIETLKESMENAEAFDQLKDQLDAESMSISNMVDFLEENDMEDVKHAISKLEQLEDKITDIYNDIN